MLPAPRPKNKRSVIWANLNCVGSWKVKCESFFSLLTTGPRLLHALIFWFPISLRGSAENILNHVKFRWKVRASCNALFLCLLPQPFVELSPCSEWRHCHAVLRVWPSTFPNMENEDRNTSADFLRLWENGQVTCATWSRQRHRLWNLPLTSWPTLGKLLTFCVSGSSSVKGIAASVSWGC